MLNSKVIRTLFDCQVDLSLQANNNFFGPCFRIAGREVLNLGN